MKINIPGAVLANQEKPKPTGPVNIPKPTPRAPCGHESPCLTCGKK